jgi:hypothetical protein
LLSHFSALLMCASFRFACSNSIFWHCFSIFSRCEHPRTIAIRQHKDKDAHLISIPQSPVIWGPAGPK